MASYVLIKTIIKGVHYKQHHKHPRCRRSWIYELRNVIKEHAHFSIVVMCLEKAKGIITEAKVPVG